MELQIFALGTLFVAMALGITYLILCGLAYTCMWVLEDDKPSIMKEEKIKGQRTTKVGRVDIVCLVISFLIGGPIGLTIVYIIMLATARGWIEPLFTDDD